MTPRSREAATVLAVVGLYSAFLVGILLVALKRSDPKGIAWGFPLGFFGGALINVLAPPASRGANLRYVLDGVRFGGAYIGVLLLGWLGLRLTSGTADDTSFALSLAMSHLLWMVLMHGSGWRAGLSDRAPSEGD